ncbi:MAG: hypothetical protein AAF607_06605 [Pseudomonadota bacterium]
MTRNRKILNPVILVLAVVKTFSGTPVSAAVFNLKLFNEETFAGSTIAQGDMFLGRIVVEVFDGSPNSEFSISSLNITTSDGMDGTRTFNNDTSVFVTVTGDPIDAVLTTDAAGRPRLVRRSPPAIFQPLPNPVLPNLVRFVIPARFFGIDDTDPVSYSLSFNNVFGGVFPSFGIARSDFEINTIEPLAQGRYEITLVPLPPAVVLFGSGLVGLMIGRNAEGRRCTTVSSEQAKCAP